MASTSAPVPYPSARLHTHDCTIWTPLIALVRKTINLLRSLTDNTTNATFPFLRLPVELRLMIYKHAILSERRYRFVNCKYHQARILSTPAVLLTSRLLHAEALPIFQRIASDEAHVFISGIGNLAEFTRHKAHLLPVLTRLTLISWKELGQPGVGEPQRTELCQTAKAALSRLRRGCPRLVFVRLQLDFLCKLSDEMGADTLSDLRAMSGVRIVGDRGSMQAMAG